MRTLYLLTICTLLFVHPPAVQSAESEEGPGNIYRSPSGKTYVKAKTPLYLHMATAPGEEAPAVQLRNEATRNGIKPFYFEGTGRHSVVHPPYNQNAKKRKGADRFYVYVDGKPPKALPRTSRALSVQQGKVTVFGRPVSVALDLSDDYSGIFAGYAALDDAPFGRYETPLLLDREDDYTLRYYAVDNVGNRSRTGVRRYAIDLTPPLTRHEIVGDLRDVGGEVIVGPRTRIALKSFDKRAGVKSIVYRLGGERKLYGKSLIDMKRLGDGPQELRYAATDRVGNAEEEKAFPFYLDRLPPVVTSAVTGDQYSDGKNLYVSGRSRLEITAEDNRAGVRSIRYMATPKKSKGYEAPLPFPQKNGRHTLSFYAVDGVGNVSKKSSRSVIVDLAPPRVRPAFDGEHYYSRKTHYINGKTVVSLAASDNLSGIGEMAYAFNEEAEEPFVNPFRLPMAGEYALHYRGTDRVNNATGVRTVKVVVDDKAPDIYYHFSVDPTEPEKAIYPAKSLLYLAATDEEAGVRTIYYQINGGKVQVYKSPIVLNSRKGWHIDVRAVDNVGNVSLTELNFRVK